MTAELIKRFNQLLNDGIIPDELNFSIKEPDNIFDWEKVRYNTFYKQPDFFINRFPEGFMNIPGFDDIIDKMVDNALEPLEEYNLRNEIKNEAEDINLVNNILDEPESIFKLDE